MTRRTGVTAGRDAGSTTGVATAVLALLSAGTLAALGVVTAGELRDVGRGPGQDSQVGGVGPPAPIALTPPPATGPARGGSGTGGGRGSGGVQSLPEQVADGSTGTSRPGLSGTGGSPAPSAPGSTPTPTPSPTPSPPPTPAPAAGPVFTGVTPTPGPVVRVLAEKDGRHPGQVEHLTPATAGKPPRTRQGPKTPHVTVTAVAAATTRAARPASSPRGRAVGHGHGGGKLPVTPVGPPAAAPAVGRGPAPAHGQDRGHGQDHGHGQGHGQGHRQGHGHGHGAAEVPVPYSPVGTATSAVPAAPAGTPEPTAAAPGNGHSKGHGNGHGDGHGKAVGHPAH